MKRYLSTPKTLILEWRVCRKFTSIERPNALAWAAIFAAVSGLMSSSGWLIYFTSWRFLSLVPLSRRHSTISTVSYAPKQIRRLDASWRLASVSAILPPVTGFFFAQDHHLHLGCLRYAGYRRRTAATFNSMRMVGDQMEAFRFQPTMGMEETSGHSITALLS